MFVVHFIGTHRRFVNRVSRKICEKYGASSSMRLRRRSSIFRNRFEIAILLIPNSLPICSNV